MEQVVLSRRNLNILLSKLDRVKNGDASVCTIIKGIDPNAPEHLRNTNVIAVIAVEDEVLYAHRNPGPMHPKDEENV